MLNFALALRPDIVMNPELKSGSTLGHYELLTRLGRGGMASVWVARERAPISGKQRLVAVKAMLPELARHSDFRAMFLEEGQIVRSIDHPHVVKVHEVSEDQGILYMAMEWVEGDSLRTLIKDAKRRRAIPAEMAVRIIADTASGLHAAHELRGWDGELRNIVHCDVSPHNILVGLDGRAKLVDFGVANAALHGAIDSEQRIKGKFGYMSPEQARAGKLDRRSDVFALGIVCYELTTGERLFRGDDAAQTLELVKNGRIPPPSEVDAAYPERLAEVVGRALARDPRQRFQTAADFRDALEQYLKHERVLVSHAGVAQLVKRVLGTRIEQQRQALREALSADGGTVVTGLVPEQPAAFEHAPFGAAPSRIGLSSEPPPSTSSASQISASRSRTPQAQTLEPKPPLPAARLLPLFAALGGIAAAVSAILWVNHRRPPPPPLVTTHLASKPSELEPNPAAHTDTSLPVGVNIDSLPTAARAGSAAPNPRVRSDAPNALGSSARAGVSAAIQGEPPTNEEHAPSPDASDANPTNSPSSAASGSEPFSAMPLAAASATRLEAGGVDLPPPDQRSPLSRGAALAALGAAAASVPACKREDGPSGTGAANVTFTPDGRVAALTLSAPFEGTPLGQCISAIFRGAHVPPFSGSSVTLTKSFVILQP